MNAVTRIGSHTTNRTRTPRGLTKDGDRLQDVHVAPNIKICRTRVSYDLVLAPVILANPLPEILPRIDGPAKSLAVSRSHVYSDDRKTTYDQESLFFVRNVDFLPARREFKIRLLLLPELPNFF